MIAFFKTKIKTKWYYNSRFNIIEYILICWNCKIIGKEQTMRLRILNLSLLFLYKYDKNLTHASDYTLSDTKNNNNYLIVFHPFTESSLLTQQTKFTRLQWTRQFRVIDSSGSPSHKHFCFSRMSKYTDLLIIQSFSQIY